MVALLSEGKAISSLNTSLKGIRFIAAREKLELLVRPRIILYENQMRLVLTRTLVLIMEN